MRVAVAGVTGKTGSAVARALLAAPDVRVVAGVSRSRRGEDLGVVLGLEPLGVPVRGSLEEVLQSDAPQVLVDFTLPSAAARHAALALEAGVRPVVGTTGIQPEELDRLAARSRELRVGAAFIANFSLGAIRAMRFAAEAARFFPDAAIIEGHHAAKLDAPSGTALRLARHIDPDDRRDVPIHSLRLAGLVAHHVVVFGSPGEILSIRHDAIDRSAYGPGVLLAVRSVPRLEGPVFDLWELTV
ncbi:MAG: 4-hydroxy-tetrahydrodipicolinate reductase [Clostridia bacterium]|nr:4-hydroxy-tetrahydrodipicolinate reductase [Clostridia bacterium]